MPLAFLLRENLKQEQGLLMMQGSNVKQERFTTGIQGDKEGYPIDLNVIITLILPVELMNNIFYLASHSYLHLITPPS